MTLGEESRRYDPRPSLALACYTGTGHDGARGSGTRLLIPWSQDTRPVTSAYLDGVYEYCTASVQEVPVNIALSLIIYTSHSHGINYLLYD